MNLTKTLLNNPGLLNLTTSEEQDEIKVVAFDSPHSGEASMKAAELRGRRIVFAFFQDDFQGGKIAYWHCVDPTNKSYRSTLSMDGLKTWKVNMRAVHK
jgi:hypothetical protein